MENQSGDAYKFYTENIGGQEIFFKEYKNDYIGKTILEVYHTLHNYVSSKTKEVYFGDITLDGKKIEKRNIRILRLDPKEIHEATEISTKVPILITNPPYIPGKTLQEYEDQLWSNIIRSICDAISKHIEMITKVKFTDMYGVAPINVKVHIKDNNVELIVTDMCCSIKNFFYSGKNAVILDNLIKEIS